MNEEIRQIQPEDDALDEEWIRETAEPGLRNVSACHWRDRPGDVTGWQVAVWAMEFIRDDPYETVYRIRIEDALRQVPGVTAVYENSREDWLVMGSPSGKALVEAAARVVDTLDARTRTEIGWTDDHAQPC